MDWCRIGDKPLPALMKNDEVLQPSILSLGPSKLTQRQSVTLQGPDLLFFCPVKDIASTGAKPLEGTVLVTKVYFFSNLF